MGLGIWLAIFFFSSTWAYTGETAAKKLRETYLDSILHQNVAFYDFTGVGEITTRIANDTSAFQEGVSEKVAICVQYFAAFIAGFVIAFAVNWRIALVSSCILPIIFIAG